MKSRPAGRFYFVGGINGSGKSTLLKQLKRAWPRKDFIFISGSRVFMDWLKIIPHSYTKLQKLDERLKKNEQAKMMRQLLRTYGPKPVTVIFDGHYFHYKKGELIDVTGPWLRSFSALFLIDAPASAIVKRIHEDRTKVARTRNLFPEDITREQEKRLIERYRKMTVQKVERLSRKYKIPYFIIHNDRGPDWMTTQFLRLQTSLH